MKFLNYAIFVFGKKLSKLDEYATNLACHIKLCRIHKPHCLGVYLGIDLIDHSEIIWCLDRSPNLNTIILGPSGSGKTLGLASLSRRLSNAVGYTLLILDLKNEYRDLLRALYGVRVNAIDPLITPLNPCTNIDALYQALESIDFNADEVIHRVELSCSCGDDSFLAMNNSKSSVKYLLKTFSVLGTRLEELWSANTILNLSTLYRVCPQCAKAIYLFVVYATINNADRPCLGTVLVLDEAWSILSYLDARRLHEVLRLARGSHVSLLLSSQSLQDLNAPKIFFENCSLVLISTLSESLIEEVGEYFGASESVKSLSRELRGVGVYLTKINYLSYPRICYVDPINHFS